MKIKQKKI